MSRLMRLVAVGAIALVSVPLCAEEIKNAPTKRADPTERLLTVLAEAEVDLENRNPNETPLFEMLAFLSKKHGVPFVIKDEAFKVAGVANIKEERARFDATQLSGLSVHQFLDTVLGSLNATYLVKNGAIEIVPVRHAAVVTKSALHDEGEGVRSQLKEPLVSVIFKDTPLSEAVAKLAQVYGLTVIVSPQAGDAKVTPVTTRLLNVPADKALELLALQCDLRIARKGSAFLITSKGQADELRHEKLGQERQKIELEKFRDTPVKPAEPKN